MPISDNRLKDQSQRLYQEILRHGMIGLNEIDKSKIFSHSEEFYARFRGNHHSTLPPTKSSCLSKSCYTDTVGKSHRRSRCTLCTLEPKLIPTSQLVYDIPLKVKGRRCTKEDDRLTVNSPSNSTISAAGLDVDEYLGDVSSNHECSWTDADIMTTISDEDHYKIGGKIDLGNQPFQETETGRGFLERFDGSCDWRFNVNVEDKDFIAALTLRNKAWHPQKRNVSPIMVTEVKVKERSQKGKEKKCLDLPKQIIAQSHWSNTNSATAVMNASMVIKMGNKEQVQTDSKAKSKIPTLKFPPIVTTSQEFFKKLRTDVKKSKRKRQTEVHFPHLKKAVPVNDRNETSSHVANSFQSSVPKTHPAGCAIKTKPTFTGKIDKPTDLEKRYPLLAKIEHDLPPPPTVQAKKKPEAPFRLPRIRILPTIGSVSIPRDRNLSNHKFKEGISGCAVASSTRR